ncbi:MAG: 2-phospho-L-lactate transferase [Candidatus Heimdallarchaeota archaeon]|nr:2-phospho-L-lactate transferase [Candidatus Heimdallarchaeota archaeon]
MKFNNLVFLSGGTGTPKLLSGIPKDISPEKITIIGNTGDDWNFYGLYVSPDIDSVLFTLSAIIDKEKWWGVAGDTFNLIDFLRKRLNEEIWFNLGDFDASLCLYRTWLLNQGQSITQATDMIRKQLGIKSVILPMSNDPVTTFIRTSEEILHLQEYWVKYKGKPEVKNVFFQGDLNSTTNEVLNAIKNAEIIIIGPSNPVSSLGPILSIKPIREALKETKAFRIAISPIIGNNPVSGPTKIFLNAWGRETNPLSTVELYPEIIDAFMIDKTDHSFVNRLKNLGIEPILEDITVKNELDASRIIMRSMEHQINDFY